MSFKHRQRSSFKKNDRQKKVAPGEFDLEKARQEVFMLGIKGFTYKDKQEAKRELAIRLGAEPKKPRGKNIKRHMEEVREKKKQIQKEREERAEMGKNDGPVMAKRPTAPPIDKKKQQQKRKRQDNAVRGFDYQIGKFKKGVQVLDRNDIKMLSKRR